MGKFGEKSTVPHSKIEELSERLISLLSLPFILYSFFLPLKFGTLWFYVSLPICSIVLVIGFLSVISFSITPLDKLVTKDTYKISRNPIRLARFLLGLELGLACASWVFLMYVIVDLILMNTMLRAEERFLLEKYGKVYLEYRNRTPKWLSIPKSEKK